MPLSEMETSSLFKLKVFDVLKRQPINTSCVKAATGLNGEPRRQRKRGTGPLQHEPAPAGGRAGLPTTRR